MTNTFEEQWLVDLPCTWVEKRADFLCDSHRTTVNPSQFGDNLVAHYSIPQVQETGGPIIEPASDIDSSKLLITTDTLLVSKLNPRKRTICIATPHGDHPTVASGEFVAIKSDKIDQRYAYYLWCSEKVTDRLSAIVQSVTRSHQRVNPSDIQKLPWKWPPLETQRRIAQFLDEKTARIDALIEKKRALLDRLAEKRQALITRAVTKGLNPDAPMKPSGIDWLGDIPAHWELKRFRFLAKLISGSTPTTTVSEYWNGDISWISPKDMKSEELFTSEDKVTVHAVNDYRLRLHEQDNAVIVIRGMILARKVPVAVAKGCYTINQDMKVIHSKGEVIPDFFQMYLSSIESFLFTLVAEAGHGTKALRTDVLLDIPFLVPPLSDQYSLKEHLTNIRKQTAETIEKISNSVSLLEEYRSALITAAVTGQLEVA
jgi:type I restriction enzyme, S subunit